MFMLNCDICGHTFQPNKLKIPSFFVTRKLHLDDLQSTDFIAKVDLCFNCSFKLTTMFESKRKLSYKEINSNNVLHKEIVNRIYKDT